jgi:biotin transport system substrate-specific component
MQKVLAVEVVNRLRIKENIFLDTVLIILGSFFVAICSQVAYYLPFSPVPITGQTFAVLLTGAVLGSRRGGLSLSLYVLEGILGLPVFAAGTSGIAVLLGPTFGYLIGFILAGILVGLLAEKGFDRHWYTMIIAFCVGQAVIYFFGVLRLSMFVGMKRVFELGVTPFLIGDVIKAGLAITLLPLTWRLVCGRRM